MAASYGPYVVEADLGRGGMGVVYRARHRETGSVAAVKVIRAGEDATPDQILRFHREIALARALDHPGIVRILEWGGFDAGTRGRGDPTDGIWFAMECIEGRSLADVLADGPLDVRRALEVLREVADALAHAHSRGVLHRDVKPSNILVGRRVSDENVAGDAPPRNTRSVFLTDFGLARATAAGSRLTAPGHALGTPEYMSPEQARGETFLTPAVDVWGCGCLLYEMLVGRTAFEGTSSTGPLEKVVRREPPRVRSLRGDVPGPVERVLRVCLAKRPRDRYRDGAALRDDVDRLLRGEEPRARPARRFRLEAALIGGAIVALAAAVALPRRVPPPALGTPLAVSDAAAEALRRAHARRASDPAGAAALLLEVLRERPEDRTLRLEWTDALREAGEWAAAEEEYGRLLAADPSDERAVYGRGLTRWLGRETETPGLGDPTPDLERAARESAGGRGALARGILAWLARRWDEAEREIGAAGGGWEPRFVRAFLLHHEGQGGPEAQEAAIREFTAVLETGPPLPVVYRERGHARVLVGDWPRAVADYTEALRLRPDHPESWSNRGLARLRLGDPRGAVEDYSEAIRLRPGWVEMLINRGAARSDGLGDHAGALADFQAALARNPLEIRALYNRGIARRTLGDLGGAVEDFGAVIAAQPGNLGALRNRGETRQHLGDLAGARDDYTEALRLAPDSPEVLDTRGVVRRLLGDPEGALEDADAAVRLRPEWPEARLNRGNARWQAGDVAGAIEDFGSALRLRPGFPEALGNRALARHASGDLAGAAADFREVLRARPDAAPACLRLARVLRDLGDRPGAAAAAGEFLRLAPEDPQAGEAREILEESRRRR
ncbi:MAG: tetratricopeptide repeat protein [Planctomycetales bacterium]|nr:tetratricopeptide repeat protein [Planctomycetales bacterium]